METNDLRFVVRGSITEAAVSLLASELNSLLGGTRRADFARSCDHIDANCAEIAADVLKAVAAFLCVCIEVRKVLGPTKPLTYDDVEKIVRSTMAKQGVTRVQILDIANFGGSDGPCVLSVHDERRDRYFKAYVFADGSGYAIEITPA